MADTPYQSYLLTQQYRDGSNLAARIRLHARFSTNSYSWFSWIFDHFNLPQQSRLLELGCGPGLLWSRNLTHIPIGWDITLTDFSPGMLDEARQRLHASSHPFTYAVVDAQTIPYPDKHFDAVIANHMLYHVPDRPRALAEIRRVLKAEGRFYASTIGVNHLRELEEIFPGRGLDVGQRFSFTLENGAEQLANFFSHVTLYCYDDALIVTEAEPLVAFYLSLHRNADMDERARAELTKRVQDRIDAHGAIHITKDSGLFEAW
jgi:SAM-dependent methyltransferase